MEKKQWLTIVAALLAVALAIERLLCPVVLSTSECMLVLGEPKPRRAAPARRRTYGRR